jgi:hypothetical protein
MITVVEIKKPEESKDKAAQRLFRKKLPSHKKPQSQRSKKINRISTTVSAQEYAAKFTGGLAACNQMAARILNEVNKSILADDQVDYMSPEEVRRTLGFWKSVEGYTRRRMSKQA